MGLRQTHKYDDIIHLPHHVSAKRAGMSIADRAAQFSPFSALTGYDAVIAESGRLTEADTELTEQRIAELDEKLQRLCRSLPAVVKVTYFLPDARKSGGEYIGLTGEVKKVDTYERCLVMTDGKQIPFQRIYGLDFSE